MKTGLEEADKLQSGFHATGVGDASMMRSPQGQVLATTFALPPATAGAAPVYEASDCRLLLNQLVIALRDFYVHRGRKEAIYGYDAVRALELLKLRAATLSDAEFHENLVGTIARVRDRHLVFRGRAPYGSAAVLPFTVESCWIDEVETYVVTKPAATATFKTLRAGARISHWNGVPIDRHIRLNANLFDGGNEASARARSLAFLTFRPLRQFGRPLEEWVDIRFTVDGAEAEERFHWTGFNAASLPALLTSPKNLTGSGADHALMELQNARRIRAVPESFDAPPVRPKTAGIGVPDLQATTPDSVFQYGTVTTTGGTFAYLRFWSFQADTADELAEALAPILPTLPSNGLIIDIRGNAGGYIAAGERLLQLFSAQPVVPERFQFRITYATRAMVDGSDEFIRWRPSFVEAFGTGEEYTRGIPIEGEDADYNRIGRKYLGPVVLIADALAISTADIFAAGFIDNDVGRVICTDTNMAAAGGNNWQWDVVRLYNPDFRIDAGIKSDLSTGSISKRVADAFNAGGASLSSGATLSPGLPQYDGTVWTVTDGAQTHHIRDLPWMHADLEVYLSRSPDGLAYMPRDIAFGLTMRRALRVRKNEGRVLEDVGIVPDVIYHMTLRDITEHNQDLLEFAGAELAGMTATP